MCRYVSAYALTATFCVLAGLVVFDALLITGTPASTSTVTFESTIEDLTLEVSILAHMKPCQVGEVLHVASLVCSLCAEGARVSCV